MTSRLKYVASGFSVDAEKLFERFFASPNKLRFSTFVEEWRNLGFTYIFMGRHEDNELREFLEEMYSWTLIQLKPDVPFERRVAALYMLYSLYVKQPRVGHSTGFQIRVDNDYWNWIKYLLNEAKLGNHFDISFVWYKLLSYGGVCFVHASRPAGPSYIKNLKVTPEERKPATNMLIQQLRMEVIPRLEELSQVHEQYRGMKDSLVDEDSDIKSCNMVQDNIFEVFKVKMDNLKQEFQVAHHSAGETDDNIQVTFGTVVIDPNSEHQEAGEDLGQKRRQLKEKAMTSRTTIVKADSPEKRKKEK